MNPTNRKVSAPDARESTDAPGTKILVVYFSRSGNTRTLANQIHQSVGGNIFEIQPEKPYPTDYEEAKSRSRQELDSGFRPMLKTKIKDIGQYGTVFIGYPMWWGTMPMPVYTFLSGYDFSGKTIVPFCTHEGSYLGRSVEDIKKLCPQSTILEGLAIWDRDLQNDSGAVTEWLRKLKMTE
jgi:flavodoxin